MTPALKYTAKKASVPDTVKIGKKTYKVTSIAENAFTGYDNLRSVKIGKNVKRIGKFAFGGCGRLTKIRLRTKKLTAKAIKGSFSDSAVTTVVVLKPAVKKYKFYKKTFTKENTDAKGKVTVKRK